MDTCLVDVEQILKEPDADVCKKLWAMWIVVAMADKATEMRYEPWRHKGILRFTVEGKEYELVPPPSSLSLDLVRTIYQMSLPRKEETWRVRLARTMRRWADNLDPPIVHCAFEFQLNLKGGMSVTVRTNPCGEMDRWVGVVLKFSHDELLATKARELIDKWSDQPPLIDF